MLKYSTGNLCALDLSKAFDKVNHHALYLKLMKRLIPNELLNLLAFTARAMLALQALY